MAKKRSDKDDDSARALIGGILLFGIPIGTGLVVFGHTGNEDLSWGYGILSLVAFMLVALWLHDDEKSTENTKNKDH